MEKKREEERAEKKKLMQLAKEAKKAHGAMAAKGTTRSMSVVRNFVGRAPVVVWKASP